MMFRKFFCETVDELTSRQVDKEISLVIETSNANLLVYLSTCLLVYSSTCLLVYLSTRLLVYSST